MISPEDKQHLMYIANAIEEIQGYMENEDENFFAKDEYTREAVARLCQEIGGGAKMLSDDFKMQYGDIDWDVLIRLEDAMYDQAMEAEFDSFWGVLKQDLPKILTQVTDIASVTDEEEDIQGTLDPKLNLPE